MNEMDLSTKRVTRIHSDFGLKNNGNIHNNQFKVEINHNIGSKIEALNNGMDDPSLRTRIFLFKFI